MQKKEKYASEGQPQSMLRRYGTKKSPIVRPKEMMLMKIGFYGSLFVFISKRPIF